MITKVVIARVAEKQIRKAPKHIASKLKLWVANVILLGLDRVREQPGFHDEPLRGRRQGQRSIRLSKKWRAMYRIRVDGAIEFVSVEEVTPHDY